MKIKVKTFFDVVVTVAFTKCLCFDLVVQLWKREKIWQIFTIRLVSHLLYVWFLIFHCRFHFNRFFVYFFVNNMAL